MPRHIAMTDSLAAYVDAHAREDAVARRLRAETATLPQAGMQIGADQAAFLALLVRGIGARRRSFDAARGRGAGGLPALCGLAECAAAAVRGLG